jgi:hypothetical protein
MAVFAEGKIEAYAGPPGLGAADDLEAVIVDFIGGARQKLDIAVQELDSEAIARAILDASWRGVRVTLFLEQDYLRTSLKRDETTHAPIQPLPQPGETPEHALERAQWGPDETEYKETAASFRPCFARMWRRGVTSIPRSRVWPSTSSGRASAASTARFSHDSTPVVAPTLCSQPVSRLACRRACYVSCSPTWVRGGCLVGERPPRDRPSRPVGER